MSAEAVVTTEQFEYLKQENALLREQVEFLMRRLYGTKRESLTDGQVDLFDQTKTFVAPTVPEPEEQDDKPAKRKKQKGRKAAQLAPFPEVAVHHELTGAERQCPHCAAEMRELGPRRPAANRFGFRNTLKSTSTISTPMNVASVPIS